MCIRDSIMPEWYFLPYYSLLKAIPHQVLGSILMVSGMGIYIILPIVDHIDHDSTLFRIVFFMYVLAILVLCYCSKNYDHGYGLWIMRLCVIYYFSFFTIILPGASLFYNNE